MSQKRARLRALAALGLSIAVFSAYAPAASAASRETSPPLRASVSASAAISMASATAASAATATGAATAGQIQVMAGSTGASSVARRAAVAASAAAPTTVLASSRVIALALSHVGARYQYGAIGPRAFDCSGLVYRVFEDAGLGRRIDNLRSATALYAHFRALHMVSTRDPQPGDLVIFGGGSHVGIYIGTGRVVNALVSGVAITRISAVYPRFTAYIHLGLNSLRLPVARTSRATHPPRVRVIRTVRTIVALSLRAAPSATAARLLVLRPGAHLAVIAISRGLRGMLWYRVIVPGGRIGWVAAAYTR